MKLFQKKKPDSPLGKLNTHLNTYAHFLEDPRYGRIRSVQYALEDKIKETKSPHIEAYLYALKLRLDPTKLMSFTERTILGDHSYLLDYIAEDLEDMYAEIKSGKIGVLEQLSEYFLQMRIGNGKQVRNSFIVKLEERNKRG